jgi:hypothetical protein
VGEHAASIVRGVFTLFVIGGVLWVVLEVTGIGSDPNSQPTRRAVGAEPTAVPTATLEPTKTPAELADESIYFDPRLLTSNAEGHVGENIYVQGEAQSVEQQDDYTWISVLAEVRNRPVTEPVVVKLRPPEPDLLSAECYRFYGVVAGATETRIVLTGVTDARPLVEAYAAEPSPRESSSCKPP